MTNILTTKPSARFTTVLSLLILLLFFPLLLLAVYQSVTLITRASGTRASLSVNTKTLLEPITSDWFHAFAQGGEEAKDMLGPVQSSVTALKPKQIRIDHIYDSYGVVERTNDTLSFNFTRLDQAVDSIRATGASPVFSLSYMPSVIAKDGNIINPPNNWDEWSLVVQKTIEHYSGEKNIRDIYYEVWNEPDLESFGKWKLSGEKNYLTLYHYASIGANNAQNVQKFFLGGPGTTGLYKNWILGLIGSNNRVDFLSWHTYNANPKVFSEDQKNLTSWLLSYPHAVLLPRLITEFGFDGGKNNLYSSPYASAFTASVIRQLISGSPKFLFSFQLKDGPNQSDGSGWGLISHEADEMKLKPRYHVYSFIDSMIGSRLHLTGEGTWVTGFATKNNSVIRVLLVNFDASGTHSETVPITFLELDPGNYTYREHFLSGRDNTLREIISDSTLSKQIFLPNQSVVLLELTKL